MSADGEHSICPEWSSVTDAQANLYAGWLVVRLLAGFTLLMAVIALTVRLLGYPWTPAVYFPMTGTAVLLLWTAINTSILAPRYRRLQRLVRCVECPSRVCPFVPGASDAP